MGGYGSGRRGGRPLAEEAKRIDLGWMLRTGRLRQWCWGNHGIQLTDHSGPEFCPGKAYLEARRRLCLRWAQ